MKFWWNLLETMYLPSMVKYNTPIQPSNIWYASKYYPTSKMMIYGVTVTNTPSVSLQGSSILSLSLNSLWYVITTIKLNTRLILLKLLHGGVKYTSFTLIRKIRLYISASVPTLTTPPPAMNTPLLLTSADRLFMG